MYDFLVCVTCATFPVYLSLHYLITLRIPDEEHILLSSSLFKFLFLYVIYSVPKHVTVTDHVSYIYNKVKLYVYMF